MMLNTSMRPLIRLVLAALVTASPVVAGSPEEVPADHAELLWQHDTGG